MTSDDLRLGVERWLSDLETALAERDDQKMAELFLEESYLRDNRALPWDYRQFHGRAAVKNLLWRVADDIKPANLRIAESWPAPHVMGEPDEPVVEVFFNFDTRSGHALGLLHGVP